MIPTMTSGQNNMQ